MIRRKEHVLMTRKRPRCCGDLIGSLGNILRLPYKIYDDSLMMKNEITRREMLRNSGIALAASGLVGATPFSSTGKQMVHTSDRNTGPCRISLNTSTIRGYQLPVEQQIDLCAEAGFDGIELWVSDVEAYIKRGGTAE